MPCIRAMNNNQMRVKLRRLRKDAGLNTHEVGRAAGLTGNTVRNVEAGKGASVFTLERIACALGYRLRFELDHRAKSAR